jgi:microtubule-associated protein, RP/EB family
VEELCSGAAYCQIFDAMFPGKVNLKRVNFKANQEYQYVDNFKVLQTAFKTLGITKIVNVVVLTGGSYQENLEFIQWIKAYYDQHVPANAPKYDAVGRRAGRPAAPGSAPGGDTNAARQSITPTTPVAAPAPAMTEKHVAAAPAPTAQPSSASSASSSSSSTGSKKPQAPTSTVSSSKTPSGPSSSQAQPLRAASTNTAPTSTRGTAGGSKATAGDMQRKVAELQVLLDRAEQERDFYFDKLRDVEIYCQTHPDQNNQVVKDVTNILYAVDEIE